ncbi:phospholipase D-like domain-containing protein [Colwellia sp. BRX8-9]|uniref:phospholipase D-like domain-containing protein n=1 Tax=Colwellia sp. BRX8-9 TaxID=2759831 RepID=UPI0015F52B91|nr:phospholipase D-like domain-containing protein [Colwellia sp. BRX8-9]MBA6349918.1 hypothetical protein [Colwellia sp. BRX8-9]
MNSLMTSEELVTSLEDCIPHCRDLNVISAFVSMPAVSWLKSILNNATVCVVGRFSPKDFIVGASNIEAVRQCILSGYTVKCLPNLHAKIYQIDKDLIFTGSANMTGKGLALVNEGNLEACTKVASSESSKEFIRKIINASIDVTLEILNKMEQMIDNYENVDLQNIPNIWPESIMPKIKELFVSDFPLVKPGAICEEYLINSALEFAVIEANKTDFDSAQLLFKSSKVYCWLKNILIDHNERRDPSFGQISSWLHDALCDDPAPYRRNIKDIQANLYEYLTLYASNEIEVYVPGRRSQVLKLL